MIVRARGSGLPKIHSASALIADQNLVLPTEIVPGVLHAGTKAVLAAPSKVGKSWMLLALSAAVATGTTFLKWNTTPGKVLFINFEILPVFMKARLQQIKDRQNLGNLDNLQLWNLRGAPADPEELVDRIIAEIGGDGYAQISLDPVYKMMPGRSENTASSVSALCQNIERLVAKTGAAVVYAHHFSKGNQAKKAAMDRMSGSGVFARDADTIITLTEHEQEDCYTVELTLRNFPPQPPFVVEKQHPLMVERPDLNPNDLKGERPEDEDD
jgi:RecA-family ATPase